MRPRAGRSPRPTERSCRRRARRRPATFVGDRSSDAGDRHRNQRRPRRSFAMRCTKAWSSSVPLETRRQRFPSRAYTPRNAAPLPIQIRPRWSSATAVTAPKARPSGAAACSWNRPSPSSANTPRPEASHSVPSRARRMSLTLPSGPAPGVGQVCQRVDDPRNRFRPVSVAVQRSPFGRDASDSTPVAWGIAPLTCDHRSWFRTSSSPVTYAASASPSGPTVSAATVLRGSVSSGRGSSPGSKAQSPRGGVRSAR